MKSKLYLCHTKFGSALRGQHVLVRIFSQEECWVNPGTVTIDSANAFLLAKTYVQFLECVEHFGIMFDNPLNTIEQRFLTVESFQRMLTRRDLDIPDFNSFCQEMEYSIEVPKAKKAAAAKKAFDMFGFDRSRMLEDLTQYGDDDTVVVEPLTDWIELHSALVTTATVLGYYKQVESMDFSELSEDKNAFLKAGFTLCPIDTPFIQRARGMLRRQKDYLSRNRDSMHYVKEFALDVYEQMDYMNNYGFVSPDQSEYSKTRPLTNAITLREMNHRDRIVGRNPGVVLLPDGMLLNEGEPIQQLLKIFRYYGSSLCLCVKENGEDWRPLARDFVRTMLTAYMGPDSNRSPASLMSSQVEDGDNSFVNALFNLVFFNDYYELIICDYCGRIAVGTKKGQKKRWCSGTCRIYSNSPHSSQNNSQVKGEDNYDEE